MKLSDHKESVGNWAATFSEDESLSICGWMDLHVDLFHKNDPQWTIEPVDVASGVRFIYTNPETMLLESCRLYKGCQVSFDQTLPHGLLPYTIANKLKGLPAFEDTYHYCLVCVEYRRWYDRLDLEVCKNQKRAKLIWKFIE